MAKRVTKNAVEKKHAWTGQYVAMLSNAGEDLATLHNPCEMYDTAAEAIAGVARMAEAEAWQRSSDRIVVVKIERVLDIYVQTTVVVDDAEG